MGNSIPNNPSKEVQIEFYTYTLLPPIAMFVKRREKKLVETFLEPIKVEKHLVAISNHPGNEESKASDSKKNGKMNKETSKTKLDQKDKVILQF